MINIMKNIPFLWQAVQNWIFTAEGRFFTGTLFLFIAFTRWLWVNFVKVIHLWPILRKSCRIWIHPISSRINTKTRISYFRSIDSIWTISWAIFQADTTFANRWRLLYSRRVIREDLVRFRKVSDLSRLELLYDRLPALVGSTFFKFLTRRFGSFSWFRQEVDWNFWPSFLTYRISPFGPVKIKSVKKSKTFYDGLGLCEDTGSVRKSCCQSPLRPRIGVKMF